MQELWGQEDADTVRVMSGFGGGIGGAGSVCGAIIGGAAALSSRYGRGTMEEKEDLKLFPLCAELYRRFATEIETSNFCRDITGIDFSKPEQVKAYFTSPEKVARCIRLVGKTAEMVRDILVREEAKSSTSGT